MMMNDVAHAADLDGKSLATGGNSLLALLSTDDLALIAPWCTRERLARGTIMTDAEQTADALYFIEYGVASIVRPCPDAETTEIALLGFETFVGAAVAIGDGRWPYRTFVQVDRLSAIRLPIDRALAAFRRSSVFEKLLVHAAYTQMVQIAEAVASVAWQRLDARLARWLLMYRDRMRSDRLDVTHEFMALMVGVQRTGVTEALHDLEGARLISAGRGVVTIRDPAGLRQIAGSGYGVPEREHARLFSSAAIGR